MIIAIQPSGTQSEELQSLNIMIIAGNRLLA